ncbi:hypothetical protein BJV82DRAFT_255144 [Fennellomyces sp. T-0311]|nr:hypothetical protein BJV82DRAFT_255144 [Fennellomyces sp. T-0311]
MGCRINKGVLICSHGCRRLVCWVPWSEPANPRIANSCGEIPAVGPPKHQSQLFAMAMSHDLHCDEADLAELEALKASATRPFVVHTLQKVLEDCQQQRKARRLSAEARTIREPIRRTKASTQTIYITSGYAWGQSDQSVIIYLPIKNARLITADQYRLHVQPRAIQFDINEHEGANYNFRISQLHGLVAPDQTKVKTKESQFIIYLRKANVGRDWVDLRLKSTRDVYDELRRAEAKGAALPSFSPTMDSIARDLYNKADDGTKQALHDTWNQSKENPFAAPSSSPEDHHHHAK